MKQLKEILEGIFDKDIVSKKLSIENYMDDFSSYALEKLEPQERNILFDQLFETGNVCNAAQLRHTPVDLGENIIIQRRDGLKGLTEVSYPCKYNFIYELTIPNNPPEIYIQTFVSTLQGYRGGYCWETHHLDGVDKKPTWKGKVSAFYKPDCTYSVVTNKEWTQNIIDGILLD